jgi:hypothetical protein
LVGEGPSARNTFAGRVDNVEYSGRDSLLDVITPAGTLLRVRGPATTAINDTLRLYVPVERALVYPAH